MALLLGTKFMSWMILRTRRAVSSVTRLEPLITRDTVALDTPANLAISRMLVGILFLENEINRTSCANSTGYCPGSRRCTRLQPDQEARFPRTGSNVQSRIKLAVDNAFLLRIVLSM